MKLNITPAGNIPHDAPRVTVTMTRGHALMFAELTERGAATGKDARTLAELYEMGRVAVEFFNGGNAVQPLPAEESDE
jgi:hypothetical protein